MKFTVLRDTQEKKNYWRFNKSAACEGTVDLHLETGDYTLRGIEEIFTIDRKANTGELSQNVCEKRFFRELVRMEKMEHPYIICDFTLEDVINFPYGSGIPQHIWPKLKISSGFLLKKIVEIETTYKVKLIFAGSNSKELVLALFKRMAAMYGPRIK